MDVLDYIGVDAYYSVNMKNIDKSIENIAKRLEAISKQWNKNIIITEIGKCSGNCRIDDSSAVPNLGDFYN